MKIKKIFFKIFLRFILIVHNSQKLLALQHGFFAFIYWHWRGFCLETRMNTYCCDAISRHSQ